MLPVFLRYSFQAYSPGPSRATYQANLSSETRKISLLNWECFMSDLRKTNQWAKGKNLCKSHRRETEIYGDKEIPKRSTVGQDNPLV